MPKNSPQLPQVTLVVLSYNQSHFVKDAVRSAIAQQYDPLEILFSDDASNDGTPEKIRDYLAATDHQRHVRVHVNPSNLGVARHFSQAVSMARGEIVVYMPADDCARSDRVSISVAPFLRDEKISIVETAYKNFQGPAHEISHEISPRGNVDSLKENYDSLKFSIEGYLDGKAPALASCARAIRRSAFLTFPPLSLSCPSDDTATLLRCLMVGHGVFVPRTTVLRRIHDKNVTSPSGMKNMDFSLLRQQYISDIEWATDLGLVDSVLSRRLMIWAQNSIERRELRRLMESGGLEFGTLIKSVMFSRALSKREKLYFLRRYFLDLNQRTI